MAAQFPDDISNRLSRILEAADELDCAYATREDYENGDGGEVQGYFFKADTVRRVFPEYEGGTVYVVAATGAVREATQEDFKP